MRYDVTYQVAGEEHTDRIDAPDAAAAAAAMHDAHGRTGERFELISVQLLDEPTYPEHSYSAGRADGALPGGGR